MAQPGATEEGFPPEHVIELAMNNPELMKLMAEAYFEDILRGLKH